MQVGLELGNLLVNRDSLSSQTAGTYHGVNREPLCRQLLGQ